MSNLVIDALIREVQACTIWLIDVVLLPVEGGIGLNDDVLASVLFEFMSEHGLARRQGFGNLRMDAKGKVRAFVFWSDGHLARFGLNFVAERWDGLDHAGTGAIRARLAEHAFERLLGALAGDADETEFVEGKSLGGRLVLFKSELQRGDTFFAVASLFPVNEIHTDDTTQIAPPTFHAA